MLIDGRSVYSPLFSDVFWDIQDVLLTDTARIEVISGPGATIWGANAVNGVINIITKSAPETRGGLARLRGRARACRSGAPRRYPGRERPLSRVWQDRARRCALHRWRTEHILLVPDKPNTLRYEEIGGSGTWRSTATVSERTIKLAAEIKL